MSPAKKKLQKPIDYAALVDEQNAYYVAGQAVLAYLRGQQIVECTIENSLAFEQDTRCQRVGLVSDWGNGYVDEGNDLEVQLAGPLAIMKRKVSKLTKLEEFPECGHVRKRLLARRKAMLALRKEGRVKCTDEQFEHVYDVGKALEFIVWVVSRELDASWSGVTSLAKRLLKTTKVNGEAAGRIIAKALGEKYSPAILS